MTIQANQGFGVSVFGAVSGGGGGSTSPGGSSGQVQYNASGSFGGMAGTSWDDTNRALTLTGATVTTSQPVLKLSQTWNAGAVTFTGLRFNATDTASASGSLLLDLQVGGVSVFAVTKDGQIGITSASLQPQAGGYVACKFSGVERSRIGNSYFEVNSGGYFQFSSASTAGSPDTYLRRGGAASLQLGAADAAAPVAQTLQVQSVVAGTSNTAGANFTINGSKGTGTGAGGSIIFQVAPAGSSGTAQNAYSTALTIQSDSRAIFSGVVQANSALTAGNLQSSSYIIVASGVYNRSNTGVYNIGTADDVQLTRDAADTLALRRSTNAQRFNVYNTYTSSTNHETFKIDWITTANTCLIGTQKGSGGGSARALAFQTDGTTRLTIETNGDLTIADAENIIVGSTTGTKIGTATSQKIGFWNADPIVQPTTAVAAATVAATGTGDVVAASTTFDGYTIPQIVKALRNAGLLA